MTNFLTMKVIEGDTVVCRIAGESGADVSNLMFSFPWENDLSSISNVKLSLVGTPNTASSDLFLFTTQ